MSLFRAAIAYFSTGIAFALIGVNIASAPDDASNGRRIRPEVAVVIMRKTLSFLSALALLLGVTSVAQAGSIKVDGVGDQFTVNFNGSDDSISTIDPWLTSSVLFYVEAFGTDSLQLKGTVANTTQSPYASRVTGLGFDVDPDATGASVTGIFGTYVLGGSFQPHGISDTLDVCVKNGNNNNCHGSNGGVAQGASGVFYLTLNFASNISNGVTFDNFVARYQGISYPQGQSGSGSGAGRGCIVGVDTTGECTTDGGDKPVPEPTTMVLTGLGLLGASFIARRRR